MLNFLPQEQKKEMVKVYYIRLAIIVTLFLIALFIEGCIGLFPSYLNEKVQTDIVLSQKKEAEVRNSGGVAEEADELLASNKQVVDYIQSRIPTLKKGDSVSFIIEKIFSKKTSAVSLKSIQFDGQNMSVSGVAATRNDLIAFNVALKQDSYFVNVALPISDIAKSEDADFTIKITLP